MDRVLPVRCGFEGVTYVDVARRVSPLELRCMAPRRTVGFGRVYLMHEDAFGQLTVRRGRIRPEGGRDWSYVCWLKRKTL